MSGDRKSGSWDWRTFTRRTPSRTPAYFPLSPAQTLSHTHTIQLFPWIYTVCGVRAGVATESLALGDWLTFPLSQPPFLQPTFPTSQPKPKWKVQVPCFSCFLSLQFLYNSRLDHTKGNLSPPSTIPNYNSNLSYGLSFSLVMYPKASIQLLPYCSHSNTNNRQSSTGALTLFWHDRPPSPNYHNY